MPGAKVLRPRTYHPSTSWCVATTLLTLHQVAGASWVQLGGYWESDADITSAALREAVEESGITGCD